MKASIDRIVTPRSVDQRVFEILGSLMEADAAKEEYLEVAAYDPDNPLHQLSTTYIEALPQDPEHTVALCELFHPGFKKEIVQPFLDNPTLLSEISEMLKTGKNITVVTAHENLIDIILVAEALNYALHTHGLVDYAQQITATELILSRTISALDAVQGDERVNALKLIRLLGNIHLTLPASDRIRSSGIDSEIFLDNARAFKANLLQAKEAPGGRMFYVAAPGTRDVANYDHEGNLESLTIQQVKSPSRKLIYDLADGLILPVATVMSSDRERCCIPMTRLLQDSDRRNGIHEVMHAIARVREDATGVTTRYDREGTLLV